MPLIGWAKPVPVNVAQPAAPAARLHAHRRRRSGQQPAAGGHRVAGARGAADVAADARRAGRLGAVAAALQRVLQLNVLLAVFNMIPCRRSTAATCCGLLPPPLARAVRPAAAVRLHHPLRADVHRRALTRSSCRRQRCHPASWLDCCDRTRTRRVGHAPDRQAPSRAPGRRAQELGRAAGRRTTASTSSPTGTR